MKMNRNYIYAAFSYLVLSGLLPFLTARAEESPAAQTAAAPAAAATAPAEPQKPVLMAYA
ncbi:hypothetical protein IT575_00860 [bacterium]|nr:hypothetical protein [bacterium]